MRTERRLLRLARPYRGLLALGLRDDLPGLAARRLHAGHPDPAAQAPLRHRRAAARGLDPARGAGRAADRAAGGGPHARGGRRHGWSWCWSLGLLLKNLLELRVDPDLGRRAGGAGARSPHPRSSTTCCTLDLGFFQRTRAGQLISGIITEVDQTKTVVTASLVSLFQNVVVVATTLVVLSQISLRLTAADARLRAADGAGAPDRCSSACAGTRAPAPHERGEVTATITERIGAVRLIRAYGEEARESARFAAQADALPEAGDPDPALLVAHQPADRGVLGLPRDPDHLGRHPARRSSAWARRSRRRRSSSS